MIWHVYYVLEDAVESGQVVCRGVSLIGHACVSKKNSARGNKSIQIGQKIEELA